MKGLKMSSIKNLLKSNIVAITGMILAFVGFIDASYLTILHYQQALPPCSLIHGCEKVLTSSFSTIYGISIAIPGMLFYITMLLLLFIYLQTNSRKVSLMILLLSISGLGISSFLLYVQATILYAFCQYCLISAMVNFLLFPTSFLLFRSHKKY